MRRSDRNEKRLYVWLVAALVTSLGLWGGIVLAQGGTDTGDPVPLEVLAAQIESTTSSTAAPTTSPTTPPAASAATTTTTLTTTTGATTTTTRPPATTTTGATTTTAAVVIIPPITLETTTTSRVPVEPPVSPTTTTTTLVPTTTTTTLAPTTTTTTTLVPTTTTLVPKPGMYVHDLKGSDQKIDAPIWEATVTVQVRNEDGKRVPGAAVTARWQDSGVTVAGGVTNDRGEATFTYETGDPQVTLTVTSLAHPDYLYTPELNRATSITIKTPY